MLSLIITIFFGLIIAYFATQNTGSVTLRFFDSQLPSMPIYVLVVCTLLIGLFLSWINGFINEIASGFTIRGKESKIKDYKKDVDDLTKRIHNLELENTKLKAETNAPAADKSK